MAKVIECDNYGRDYQTETVVAQNLSDKQAKVVASSLNNIEGENSEAYYKVVEDEYISSLASMYDVIDEDMPAQRKLKHLGVSLYDVARIKLAIDELSLIQGE